MKETLVNHSYIKIISYVENYMNKKIYFTHIIMLNDYMLNDIKRFKEFIEVQFPTIESAIIVRGKE